MSPKFNNNLVLLFLNFEDFNLCIFQVQLCLSQLSLKRFDYLDHFLVRFLQLASIVFLLLNGIIELIYLLHESKFALRGLKKLFLLFFLVERYMAFEIDKFLLKEILWFGKSFFSSFHLFPMFFNHFLNVFIILLLHLFFRQENILQFPYQIRDFLVKFIFHLVLSFIDRHPELNVFCDRILYFRSEFCILLLQLKYLLLIKLIVLQKLIGIRFNLLLRWWLIYFLGWLLEGSYLERFIELLELRSFLNSRFLVLLL